jgi:cyclic pyranopterin phosphate synthase
MDFSHIDEAGRVRMVDVSDKPVVKRTAVASAAVFMKPETVDAVKGGALRKGDPIACARIAGIMAAKRTGGLIPLCHPLPIDRVGVTFEPGEGKIAIETTVVATARTGVEMEALTAAAVAALTIYDMCKAIDKDMAIGEITLKRKTKET